MSLSYNFSLYVLCDLSPCLPPCDLSPYLLSCNHVIYCRVISHRIYRRVISHLIYCRVTSHGVYCRVTSHRVYLPVTSHHVYRHAHARSCRALVGSVPSYCLGLIAPLVWSRPPLPTFHCPSYCLGLIAPLVWSRPPLPTFHCLFGGCPFSLLHHELSLSPLDQLIPLSILTCGNHSLFKRKERWRKVETPWGGPIVSCSCCPLLFLFAINVLRRAVHSNFPLLCLNLSKKALLLSKLAARSPRCLHSQIQGCRLRELARPASSP